jgi:hypothetical protein
VVWVLVKDTILAETMSKENFEALKKGNFGVISDIIIAAKDDDDILLRAAKIVSEKLDFKNWKENSDELMDIFLAGFENTQIFKAFEKVFEKPEMLDFSRNVVEKIASAQCFSQFPIRVVDLALYITSRVAQKSPQEYEFTVSILFSTLLAYIDKEEYPAMEEQFIRLCSFQPELTNFKLFSIMKDQMISMTNQLRDGIEVIGKVEFFNKCHLWAHFAFQNESFAQAYTQFIVHVMKIDKSLKLNPLRLKLSGLLVEHNEFLAPIAPLSKILSKSLSTKRDGVADFDFDELIMSTKEIGRTEEYQDELFSRTYAMLRTCLFGLKNRIAFPEIAAPVVRTLEIMKDDEAFKPKADEINTLMNDIKANSTWIEKEREQLVQKTPGFKITEVLVIEGKAPFKQ